MSIKSIHTKINNQIIINQPIMATNMDTWMNTLPDNNLFNGGVLVSIGTILGINVLDFTPYIQLYCTLVGAILGTLALV